MLEYGFLARYSGKFLSGGVWYLFLSGKVMGGHKKATRKLTGFNPERITARSPVNKLTPLSKTYRAGDDVYRSSTYRKESQQLREQSNGICQLCGKQVDRVLVDHIIEIKDGGTDTPDNRMVICYSCHKYKTDAEKRRRMGVAP